MPVPVPVLEPGPLGATSGRTTMEPLRRCHHCVTVRGENGTVMKLNRLAGATLASLILGAPALVFAQVTPGEGAGEGDAAAEPAGEVVPPDDAMPEPPPPPPPADEHGAELHYDGGFVLASADDQFELKLGLRNQLRFEVLRADLDADDAEFAARFLIPRSRLQLEGHAYGHANTYKVEFELANRGFALLKDVFIDHALSKGLHVRLGQWKKPLNRQELVSDFGSEFLERSIMNELAGAGRDQGIALHNDYEKSPEGLEWAIGVFNASSDRPKSSTTCVDPADPTTCSTGLPTNIPSDFGPLLVARAGWNQGKIKGYSEGDLEGGPLRFAVAASYALNANDLDKDADDNLRLRHTVVFDAMAKVEGLTVTGALTLVKDGQADLATGFYAQASYMLVAKKVLGAVRFAQIPEDDEHRQEILGGVNYMFKGHKAKLMLDAGILNTTGDPGRTDLQIRSQLQLVL